MLKIKVTAWHRFYIYTFHVIIILGLKKDISSLFHNIII